MELCLITLAGTEHVLIEVFFFLVGVGSLYCFLCLREAEEGKIQNRIEKLWIDVDDERKRGEASPLAARSARILRSRLDRIFGAKPISLRMVTISLGASLLIYGALLIPMVVKNISAGRYEAPWAQIFAIGTVLFPAISFMSVLQRPTSRFPDLVLLIPFVIWLLWPIGFEPTTLIL